MYTSPHVLVMCTHLLMYWSCVHISSCIGHVYTSPHVLVLGLLNERTDDYMNLFSGRLYDTWQPITNRAFILCTNVSFLEVYKPKSKHSVDL